MTCLGIDTIHRFTAADAGKAAANGVRFVGRYLVPAGKGKDITTLVTQKADRNEANSTYHMILGAAAISQLPEHGAVMLTSDCGFVMWQSYTHGEASEEV